MNTGIQIAGRKTVKDWLELKHKLENDFDNNNCGSKLLPSSKFVLEPRYLAPAEIIQNDHSSKVAGEGFAITAIICTLIESFESFLQGKNYKYLKKGQRLSKYEYNKSSDIFVDFLTKREPFKKYFHKRLLAPRIL